MIEKLIKVQNELKVPKNHKNDFGNYNYRTCEDILESVKPILQKYNLLMTIKDELIAVGERVYIKATVTITDGEKEIITTALAKENIEKKKFDDPQLTGSASSYARKYALNGMFCIDDVKDSDATNTDERTSEKTEVITEKQNKMLYAIVKSKSESDPSITGKVDKILKGAGYNKFKEIEKSKFNSILEAIKKL